MENGTIKRKVNIKPWDSADFITDAECARLSIWAAAEIGQDDFVVKSMEDVKRAAARHNFEITPEILEEYAKARATVRDLAWYEHARSIGAFSDEEYDAALRKAGLAPSPAVRVA
ncbi:MAG: hypothetical protein FWB94_12465 [Chitinispirillia bacterium]|nr:hypothetical protein [Chitinispirillia bacterium]